MKNIIVLLSLGAVALAFVFVSNSTASGDVSAERSSALSDYRNFEKPTDKQLSDKLTPLQYRVTQHDSTERPFQNAYWDNKEQGIYVDIVSGEPLFSSADKFKSGTGWPSFIRTISGSDIVEKEDKGLFYSRTELRSKVADSHLGHVFKDGPAPTGLRYCINSASLKFVAKEDLAAQGYADFTSQF